MSCRTLRQRLESLIERALTPKEHGGHECGKHAFRCQMCQALHAMHILSGGTSKCHMCCDD
jgi:hypothetical protein